MVSHSGLATGTGDVASGSGSSRQARRWALSHGVNLRGLLDVTVELHRCGPEARSICRRHQAGSRPNPWTKNAPAARARESLWPGRELNPPTRGFSGRQAATHPDSARTTSALPATT